jgi:hypothetical protein
MEFFYAFGGFFFPFGVLLLSVVVLAVAAVVGRRAAPDPTGRRPFAIYLLSVMFITLLTTAGAVAQIGGTLANLVNDEPDVPTPVLEPLPPVATLEPIEIPPESVPAGFVPLPPSPDPTVSQILEGLFIGMLSAGIFEFHRRRWNVILRAEAERG